MLSAAPDLTNSIYNDPDALLDDLLNDDLQGKSAEIAAMSLEEFCEKHLWIQDKQDRLIPFRLNNVQRHFIKAIEASNNTRHLIVKARQFGFSTLIQALQFKKALERPSRFMTMAHDDDTTQKLRRMSAIFYDNLDDDLKMKRTSDNAGVTAYENLSEVTIKTAGARIGGRGGTYGAGMHGSEVAFWKDAKSIVSGAMQAIPQEGHIFWESTANGARGAFYDEVQKALNGESEFTLHFYPWWWGDEYRIPLEPGETLTYTDEEQALVDKHGLMPEQIKWRRRKMREPEMDVLFPQEYPEDVETCFLTSGNSAFPGVHLVMGGPYQEQPVPNRIYVAGLDWGQDENYSSLCIIDPITLEEVYLNRWRHMLYESIRAEVVKACQWWQVGFIMPEKNSMSGNVESLIKELHAVNDKIVVEPFIMSLPAKHELVTSFKEAYQTAGLRLLDIPYAKHEMNIFVKKQTPTNLWTYGAEGKGGDDDEAQDDTVIARLLARLAVLRHSLISVQRTSAPGLYRTAPRNKSRGPRS